MKKQMIYALIILPFLSVLLSGCGSENRKNTSVSGARSGVLAIETVMKGVKTKSRSAALLGIFVSEYISVVPLVSAAESALLGVGAQIQIAESQTTVQDPDFELLQAFTDALSVDVPDLLNRSDDREQALDTYREALNNVASRANDRFKELDSSLDVLKDELRTLSRARSDAERSLKNALKEKDYSSASEKQRAVNEAQAAESKADLQRQQVEDLRDTLEEVLTLYGTKITAIDANREPLITGAKVTDIEGIDDLNLIERVRSNRRSNTFEGLF